MRAVTEMDSGRPRLGAAVGTTRFRDPGAGSNMDKRLVTEPDRSSRLRLPPSGEDSSVRSGDGGVWCRNEFALSITDGDLDGSRFFTAKKVDEGLSLVGAARASVECAERCSSSLIRSEMTEPILDFLARFPPCCF